MRQSRLNRMNGEEERRLKKRAMTIDYCSVCDECQEGKVIKQKKSNAIVLHLNSSTNGAIVAIFCRFYH